MARLGVIDSGVGGLTSVRAIRAALPDLSITYVADTANVPYGEKPETDILTLTRRLVDFLVNEGIQDILLACNSITTTVVETLRKSYENVDFIGIAPPIKPAAGRTESGTIAVFATPVTLASAYYAKLKETHGRGITIVDFACPAWVRMVEAGKVRADILRAPIDQALKAGADVFALGCTHFPALHDEIAKLAPNVDIIDNSPAIAARVSEILADSPDKTSLTSFLATAHPENATRAAQYILPGIAFEEVPAAKMLHV